MGLLFGASIFTVAELLEFVLIALVEAVKRTCCKSGVTEASK